MAAHVITGATVLLLALLVLAERDSFRLAVRADWRELASWGLLIILVNLLPLRVEDFSLTLDLPLLLAVAISLGPAQAATVAFIATVDTRRLGVSRALFNRSQVALCVLLAGMTFHAVAPGLEPLMIGIAATGLALFVDYALNTALVVLHISARRGMAIHAAFMKLTVGSFRRFLATYLGFGIMALVLAHVHRKVGFWPVAVFLVPLAIARQALLRDLSLQRATERLALQRRLLERALGRSSEEREDERRRVASALHDDVLQLLIALRMCASEPATVTNRGKQHEELLERIDIVIARLRAVVGGLKNSPLGPGGLIPTLRALVRDLSLEWRCQVSLEISGDPALPGGSQVLLYQILREALVNALKHSQSREVKIRVVSDSAGTAATVEDYGIGFVPRERTGLSHFGLELMRERADRLGASLNISSSKGKGTRLSITIPSACDREPR